MTLENAKRLYEHYINSGNKEAAEDLKKKYKELGANTNTEPNSTQEDPKDKKKGEK